MSTLETRIEKLERKLREAQARKSSTVSMIEHDPEPTLVNHHPVQDTRGNQKRARQRENRDIDDLVSDFGLLYVVYAPPSCSSMCGY